MSKPDLTPLQEAILYTKYHNPNLTHKQIAKKCECSKDWVSQVLSNNKPHEVKAVDNPTTPEEVDRNYTQPEDRKVGTILAVLVVGYLAGRALGWW